MTFARNSDLPYSVRALDGPDLQKFRYEANAALKGGASMTDAFRAGYRALKGTGPGAGDVHVDTPLGSKPKRRRRRTSTDNPRRRKAELELPAFIVEGPNWRAGRKQAQLTAQIFKTDEDQHLVWGWASIVEKDGTPIVDLQGDIIAPETLVKAAHDFITVRVGKAMHEGEQVAQLVESMVFTKDVAAALDIDVKGRVGWAVAFKVFDEGVWQAIKAGELKAFSIGGFATPETANA